MPNNPFDRTIIQARERPLSTDINQAQSQLDRTARHVLRMLLGKRNLTVPGNEAIATLDAAGFIGDGFRPAPANPVAMTVQLQAGLGFFVDAVSVPSAISGVSGLDDLSPYKPLHADAAISISVPAADGSNPRIDIIEVKYNRLVGNPLSRDVLDTGTGAFTPTSVNKTLGFSLSGSDVTVNGAGAVNYKTGTAAASPVMPATSSGYVKIGEVLVGAAVTTLDYDVIKDLRHLLMPGGVMDVSCVITRAASNPLITITSVVAPPGVQILAHANGGAAPDVGVDVFIVAGGAIVGVDPVIRVLGRDANAALTQNYFLVRAPVVEPAALTGAGVFTSTQAGLLNGATQANPVKVPANGGGGPIGDWNGQPRARVRLQVMGTDGTDQQTTFTAPFQYHFSARLALR